MRLYKHGTYINERYTFTRHQIGKRIPETEIKSIQSSPSNLLVEKT